MKELASALVDRDRAICEKNELLEKFCHEVKDKAEAQKELNQACKDIETVREERDVARKERTEAIIQRDQLLQEYYQARQVARRTDDLSSQMEGLVYFSDSNPFIPSHIVVVFFFSSIGLLVSTYWFLLRNVYSPIILFTVIVRLIIKVRDAYIRKLPIIVVTGLTLTSKYTRNLHCVRNGLLSKTVDWNGINATVYLVQAL